MTEPVVVDLAAKKTEAEWQATIDLFWLAATPEVFKWLGWVAALSVLKFVAAKSQSSLVAGIQGLCFAAVIFYFNAYFFRFRFKNPPFLKSPRTQWFLSLALSGVLATVAQLLALEVVNALSQARP